ncbi:MAG: hypothetical protein ACOC7T_00860 [Planctomycetota bacterium]
MRRIVLAVTVAFGLLGGAAAGAERQDLLRRQERARRTMRQVERRLGELAELLGRDRPQQAERLQRALAASRREFVLTGMEEVESQLTEGDYAGAEQKAREVLEDLRELSAMLESEGRAADLRRLREARSRLAELLRRQRAAQEAVRELAARPGPDPAYAEALQRQQAVRDALSAYRGEFDDMPGAAQVDSAMQNLQAALRALQRRDADTGLAEQGRAVDRLREAVRRLEAAAQAERARRRARARRTLRETAERMLEEQRSIRRQTGRLDARVRSAGELDRALRLRARELAGRQSALGDGAARLLEVLRGDGTTRVLPGVAEQVARDVESAAALLADAVTGPAVQGIQADVEAALEAIVEAVKGAAAAEGERQPTPPEQQRRKGERRPPPLVRAVREVKVLRAMQASVNRRTRALGRRPEDGDGRRRELARLRTKQAALAEAARRMAEAGEGEEQ